MNKNVEHEKLYREAIDSLYAVFADKSASAYQVSKELKILLKKIQEMLDYFEHEGDKP